MSSHDRFKKFDFDSNSEWRAYQDNLHFPETADKAKLLDKYKRKWYEKHIETIDGIENEVYECPYKLVVEHHGDRIDKVLIMLHGLGDSGTGWRDVAKMLAKEFPGLKVYCPSATTIPVTISFGIRIPAWFDIKSTSEDGTEDVEGLKRAQKNIHDLMDHVVEKDLHGNSQHLMIGGFSQGGCMSLLAGLTYHKKIAGIFGLSTFAVGRTGFDYERHVTEGPNHKTPFLMCHGTNDGTVKYEWGHRSFQKLLGWRPENTTFKTYKGMGHTASLEEVNDIKQWMRDAFAKANESV